MRETLEARFGPPTEAQLLWKPTNTVPVAGHNASALLKLLEALEELDDVQNVYANFDIPESVMAELG